jgi:hypothetical protein
MRSLLIVCLMAGLMACKSESAPQAKPVVTQAAAPPVAGRPTKVVFMDKENACACTRKRTDATWAALQSALGTPSKLPVERLHVDTQAEQAVPYTSAKPLMVPPGIYFVDGQQKVVELLQGEVSAAEVTAVLAR